MGNSMNEFLNQKIKEQEDELKEFIKEYVKEENLDQAVEIHNQYVRAIPLALRVFSNLVLDPEIRQEIRSYFSLVIAYILEPENYLRKSVPTSIDMLVNAYVLHTSLETAINTLTEEKKNELEEKLAPFKPVFELNPIVRSKIPEHLLVKQDIIINYLQKILEVKSSVRDWPIFIFPPKKTQ